MSKPFLFALALVTSLLASSLASADPRPLSEKRSRPYYWTHGSLAAGGLALGVAATPLVGEHRGHHWGSFYPDDWVELSFSESAAALSDNLLVITLALPLLVQMSQGFDTSMANATLLYGQAHALNLALTATTKLIARRSRPYTRSHDPRIQEFADNQGSEAHVSFFSGHVSSSFTAATAGSILYSARTDELWARHTVWGLEFLLAGMTAQLRVRAGRHYRTDIWTGTAVGIGVGVLVPALHRVDMSRVKGTELASAAVAGGVTLLLSELVDFCDLLDLMSLCGLPRDVRIPVQPSRELTTGARWFVLPAVVEGGGGLQLTGEL